MELKVLIIKLLNILPTIWLRLNDKDINEICPYCGKPLVCKENTTICCNCNCGVSTLYDE